MKKVMADGWEKVLGFPKMSFYGWVNIPLGLTIFPRSDSPLKQDRTLGSEPFYGISIRRMFFFRVIYTGGLGEPITAA